MRKLYVILVVFYLCQLTNAGGKTYTPEVYGEKRYQHIWARKPFSPPTPTALAPQGEEKQYVLSGLVKMGDEWIAFVQERKSLQRHSVSVVPNESGLQLVSVYEDAQASTIVLRCGEQTITIGFDPAVSKGAAEASQILVQNPPVTEEPPSPVVSATPENTPAIQTLHSSTSN